MRKIKGTLLLIFFSVTMFSQSSKVSNLVTSLDVSFVDTDTISIKWRSDIPEGVFSIYYNNKEAISDKYKLALSELLVQKNFTGIPIDTLFLYELVIDIKKNGRYFFAVVPSVPKNLDAIARGLDVPDSAGNINLIPSINTLIQPIVLMPERYQRFQDNKQETFFHLDGYILTALNLESDKDVFRLRWSVHPNNLSQYVFKVYRSRYPIHRYSSFDGLPVYASVTNQFYFEDTYINFETPYYYAVVPEKSRQWQVGINIFQEPAVLQKNSPPFIMKPTVEYVKSEEQLFVKRNTDLTETDIQEAVQKTLMNLEIIPKLKETDLGEREEIKPLTEEEKRNLKLIEDLINRQGDDYQQVAVIPKLSQTMDTSLLGKTKREFVDLRDYHLALQKELEKDLINKQLLEYGKIKQSFEEISNKIEQFKILETHLLGAYKCSKNALTNKIAEYYTLRDKIYIDQFSLKNQLREKDLKITSLENEFKDRMNFIWNSETEKRQILIQRNIELHQKNIELQKERKLELYNRKKSQFVDNLAGILTKEVNGLNTNDLRKINLGEVNPDFKRDRVDFMSMKIEEEESEDLEDFSWTNDLSGFLTEKPKPEQRVKVIKQQVSQVVVEIVPSIEEMTSETWLTPKDIAHLRDPNQWQDRLKTWNENVFQILGDRYSRIQSKWLSPAPKLAATEAARAYQEGRYDEALYLLMFVPKDQTTVMMLGQSFYQMGAYHEAFTVFMTAFHMNVPNSRKWLDMTSEKLLQRNINK